MDIRPIRNDDDLRAAIKEIDRLWGAPLGSDDGDKLDVLATLVDAYERDHFRVQPSSPVDMLRYAVGDMGRTQTELAEVVGSRSLASQLLSGTRRISLDAAQKISAAWHNPDPVPRRRNRGKGGMTPTTDIIDTRLRRRTACASSSAACHEVGDLFAGMPAAVLRPRI